MRFARRTDDNHQDLVRQLRQLGVWVESLASVGNGMPDLIAATHTDKCFVLLEVKDPTKKPSAQRLTSAEAKFHAACPGPVHVVRNLEEAVEALFPVSRGKEAS